MSARWIAGWLLVASVAVAVPTVPADPGGAPDAAAVTDLVRRLGDDSYRVREEASQRLWMMGEDALPVLRDAMRSRDPEIVSRARMLADQIDLGILPDTKPEVRALVARYRATNGPEKLQFLEKLQEMKAWRPILKLFEREKEAEVRQVLRDVINAVAVRAAREAVGAGRLEEARLFLEMAPTDAGGLMALASFHVARGTAQAEWNKAKDLDTGRAKDWRLALKRASGDIPAAIREARAAGDSEVAAALCLLTGDPLPWLERKHGKDGDGQTFFHQQYAKIAARQWRSGRRDEEGAQALVRAMKDANEHEEWFGISSLFLVGRPTDGEKALEKMNHAIAFGYYATMERANDALRIVGLNPASPDYVGWAKERADKVLDAPDENEEAAEDLLLVAAYLDQRGMGVQAKEWLDPFFDRLMAKDGELFMDRMGELVSFQAPELIIDAAARFAGENENQWADVLQAVTGGLRGNDEKRAIGWWKWLAKLDPQAAPVRRFEAVLAVLGELPRQDAVRRATIERAWQAVDAAPKDERGEMLELMAYAGRASRDLTTSLRALRALVKDKPEHPQYGYYLMMLSAADEWQEALGAWRALLAKSPDRPDLMAYLAAVLRRTGQAEDAARVEKTIALLTMGDGAMEVRIGQGYAYAGDFARANEWWRRAMIESRPGEGPWDDALELCCDAALMSADWPLAAALGEARAMASMEGGNAYDTPVVKLRTRFHADMARAFARLGTDRKNSLATLEACHAMLPVDGTLADHFLPALRGAGLKAEHDRWFAATWQGLMASLERYPQCDNTMNTCAWVAARAGMRLDEGEELLKRALSVKPRQAAYLDTMGELWFARHNREKALEWSHKAVAADPADEQLRRQLDRFSNGPFPP